MSRDFTLDKYAELCKIIQKAPWKVVTLAQFLRDGQPQEPMLMLRHDIDRGLSSALRMAEMEACFDIRSTYYVRMTPSVYKPETLTHLHRFGHEIGYHYEVLAKSRGDHKRALEIFEEELAQLRQIAPVHTASAHGSPTSSHDSRDIWHAGDIQDYGLLGEAYLSIDPDSVYYFTDTGRCWDAEGSNLRDRAESRQPSSRVHSTDDLADFLGGNPTWPVVINVHPNRWAANQREWVASAASDLAINWAKRIVAMRRIMFSGASS